MQYKQGNNFHIVPQAKANKFNKKPKADKQRKKNQSDTVCIVLKIKQFYNQYCQHKCVSHNYHSYKKKTSLPIVAQNDRTKCENTRGVGHFPLQTANDCE